MNWNFKVNITTLLLIVVGALAIWQWNKAGKEADRWERNYEIKDSEFKSYKSETDGTLISYQKQIELTDKELKEALKSDSTNAELAKHYKKLSENVQVETEFVTKWDTLKVPVPIYVDKDTTVGYFDSCLSFDLSVSNGFVGVSDLSIENELNFVSGQRKLGFLKGTEYSVDVQNTNECVITTGITSYKVIHKPTIWENQYIWGGAGFVLGFVLGGK